MKKGLVIGIATIVVLLVIVFIGLKLNSPAENTQIQNPGNENADFQFPQSNNIEISNFAFSPTTLTIKIDDTVTWTNWDLAKHTVTSDSGDELNSELISKGQTYSHTFTKAGTYDYYCTPHPYMTGKVVVE